MISRGVLNPGALCIALLLSMASVQAQTPSNDARRDEQPSRDAPPVDTQPEQPDMQHQMDMSSMQGGRAPADARDPDYSDGLSMSAMPGMTESMDDAAKFGKLLIDQLELVHGVDANGAAFDVQAWYGGDQNKLWLKADGERSDGRVHELRTEALWNHAASAFWNTQFGVRHDFGAGPDRSWAAFGVQGMAPYWITIEASAYVGPNGRSAARFEAEYDLLLTQRLVLTPDLELNAYDRSDTGRRIGAGLSNIELGLRLRYEITRQFAPYIGIDLNRRVGDTADLVRADGDAVFDRAIVAGVHVWF